MGPLSEFYGRKPVYIVSYFFFIIWQIPTAVAPNIATILVTRGLAGFSGAAFLSVAGGSITDMWPKQQVAWPMVVYTLGPFLGPTIGPVVGGFINAYTDWRWTFYVILIWAGVQVPFSNVFSFLIVVFPFIYRSRNIWPSRPEKQGKMVAQH